MANLSESESPRLCSWLWDSHITPKNSKWLQENLTDMDSKIKAMIKLLTEDADSFARRAEMYYKKRPELMKFVEEFYRAYRALAERYDYTTGELRHAHRAMAEAFPDHPPPFFITDDSPTVRGAHIPNQDADVSRKTLENLQELFGSAENPEENPGSGEVENLKKALSDLETEKEAVCSLYEQKVKKLCNIEDELNRVKTDCFKLKVQAVEAEKEVCHLKGAVSKLEADKEDDFFKLNKKIADTEDEAMLLRNRADSAESEVKKLEESLQKLKEEKEDYFEKISELEKEICSLKQELKYLRNEILTEKSRSKSVEQSCLVLEISNRALRLEAENLMKKIALEDQKLAKKHVELEKFDLQVQEERARYVQAKESLKNLENLQSRSTEELKNGLQLLKEMEISKNSLEEELWKVKDENLSLNAINSSSCISIRNLESEIGSLRKMTEKLKEELGVRFQEILCLKEEIKCLNLNYNDFIEQVLYLGLKPDSFGSSVKDLREAKQKCDYEREEREEFSKKIKDMEEKFERTHAQEKEDFLSQLQIITNTMEDLLERNKFLESKLSGAKIEIECLTEKSKNLKELSRVVEDEKSNLVKERSDLVIQLENVEKRLGNLEEKFVELEGRYMGIQKEKKSTLFQVEELKVWLGAEKEERESLSLWSETCLASLQSHVDLLEEEGRWRKIQFQEELDKAVISEFEIFLLQKFIQEMEEENKSVCSEFQKLVEESKYSEKLIEELEKENLEQQFESELLSVEIEKLRLAIYQVFKAISNRAEEKIQKKEENLIQFIIGHIKKNKVSLTKYKEDLQKLLVEKSVILAVLDQMQNENGEAVEMNEWLRSEMGRRDKRTRSLEEQNRSLLGKCVDLKEEKSLLESFALDTISVLFKSFVTEKALEFELLSEDLLNTRSLKRETETENSFLKNIIRQLDIELNEVKDLNVTLCKSVEGLKRENEESKLMQNNSKLQIIKQKKEIQTLCEEIEERRTREQKVMLELCERNDDFESWKAEAEKLYSDLQTSVFREVLFEDKVKELGLMCEKLEDECGSKTREIELVNGRVDLTESEIGGLRAQLHAYSPIVAAVRQNLASLQHNTLSLTNLIAANNKKSKDKANAADISEESCQEVVEEQNSAIPSGISELKMLQKQIKEVEKVVVEQKNKLLMREIEEMKSNCSPVRVKVDQNRGPAVLWDKPALDDLKLRSIVKTKKLGPKKAGVSVKDIPLDEICTQRSSKSEYQRRDSPDNDRDEQVYQSSELQIKKGNILQRLASNSQQLSYLQTNVQELKTKIETNKIGGNGKGDNVIKLKEKVREAEESLMQMTGSSDQLKRKLEESHLNSDEDSIRFYEEAQNGIEGIALLHSEVQNVGRMITKMEIEKKNRWKMSLSRMKSRTKIVVRSLIYFGRMRKSNSFKRKKKGCLSGCIRSSRN